MFAYRSPTQWWTSLMRPSNWDVKEQQCIRVLRPKRCAHPHIHLWAGENSLKAGFPGYFSSVTNKKENDFYKNIKGRGKKGSQNQELLMISSNETHWVKHLVLIFSPVTLCMETSPVIFKPLLDNHRWLYKGTSAVSIPILQWSHMGPSAFSMFSLQRY